MLNAEAMAHQTRLQMMRAVLGFLGGLVLVSTSSWRISREWHTNGARRNVSPVRSIAVQALLIATVTVFIYLNKLPKNMEQQ